MLPLLPYDVYVAAQLFLDTGHSEAEVLARIELSSETWSELAPAYLDLLHDNPRYVARLATLWPEHTAEQLDTALVGPRWRFEEDGHSLGKRLLGIRRVVHQKPHFGPFADVPWRAQWICDDPVATLLHYSHDGEHVYCAGSPLRDRRGHALALDAERFRHLGGRWYGDGQRALGQTKFKERRVWWQLEGVDLASFVALNDVYARDAEQAWYIAEKRIRIRTRSPERFAVVPWVRMNWRTGRVSENTQTSRLARDAERVYSYGARIAGAAPDTFRALGQDYATDGRHVWTQEGKRRLEGADAASFHVASPADPLLLRNRGAAATDRERAYDRFPGGVQPIAAEDAFDDWTAFFSARPDRSDWWWGKLASTRSRND